MAGTQTGDSQTVAQSTSNPTDSVASRLSEEANNSNQIGMNGVFGGVERFGLVTADGVAHLPGGLVHAVANEAEHPAKLVETVAGSAAIGAILKTVLPEAGPVGKIAALAMGAWFVGSSMPGFIGAYSKGLSAKTWSQLNDGGSEWGDTAGQLGVNSLIGFGGYKIGAGLAGDALASESFDNFADSKQDFWNSVSDKVKAKLPDNLASFLNVDKAVPTASTLGITPHYTFDGDTAKLMDSARTAPPGDGTPLTQEQLEAPMSVDMYLKRLATPLAQDRYNARMATGQETALTDENDAFAKRFGSSQESADAVKQFAQQNNLSVDATDLRNGRVSLSGKTADFQSAFKIELKNYDSPNGAIRGREGVISLPKDLSDHVRAVLGNDDRPAAITPERLQFQILGRDENGDYKVVDKEGNPVQVKVEYAKSLDDPKGNVLQRSVTRLVRRFGPQPSSDDAAPGPGQPHAPTQSFRGYLATDVAKAQNMPLSTGGEGQSGAFISLGGGFNPADDSFFADHGLPTPKPLNQIYIDGATNDFGDPQGADGENSLDRIQMQSLAPQANISAIVGTNTDQSFNNVFQRGIFPQGDEEQNSVVSSSWGANESAQTSQSVNVMSQTMRDAVTRGVKVFSASGDTGADDGASSVQVDYPASDPNVTGVGGLKMVLGKNDNIISVTAWNEGQDSSTGGGISRLFSLPAWQKGIVNVMNAATGKAGRGVPDISTDADPATGFVVPVDGNQYVIGGTSDAAPLYAGMMLNINSALAAKGITTATPLNPWMYARANNASIFKDVTTGNNNGYQTAKGWDPVTGLGYVDGQAMQDAMMQNPTTNLSFSQRVQNFRPGFLGLNPQQSSESSGS